MSRVIQIRDVPDDVHEALVGAAEARGLSLTRYMLRELEHLARQAQAVRDNAAVIRETQARVGGRVAREPVLTALHQGRGDRGSWTPASSSPCSRAASTLIASVRKSLQLPT